MFHGKQSNVHNQLYTPVTAQRNLETDKKFYKNILSNTSSKKENIPTEKF